MSRIRSIKPEFWTNSKVIRCSPIARLLFIGLWNFCDDVGRHPMDALQVKAEVFPAETFSEETVIGLLTELTVNNLIIPYTVDGKEYFEVKGWEHQLINRPQASRYPAPFKDHSVNIQGAFTPDRIGLDRIRKNTSSDDDGFLKFWQEYPRKVGKKAAEKAFARALKETSLQSMLSALAIDKEEWKEIKFIPHPATWLNGGRYLDHEQVALKTYQPPEYKNGHKPENTEGIATKTTDLLDQSAGVFGQKSG